MKRILIVDDAVFIRQSLKIMLERNGFEVAGEADNGEKAIDQYKQLSPDIVTMDITMPVMDGIEAVQEIKKLDKNANIVMMTALGQQSMVKKAIELGVKGFIIKPFSEQKIIKVLKEL